MSVIPFPVMPEPTEPEPAPQTDHLRLVTDLPPAHDHVWRLRAIEYDDSFEVRRYECESCGGTHFR